MTSIALAGIGLWFLLCWTACRNVRGVIGLAELNSTLFGQVSWPSVSVIIPARNEEHTILPTLRALSKLDYPNARFILVDDRSTDGTAAIIAEWIARDSRFRLAQVTSLPDGWLGKLHALEVGRKLADSEWLLFADADAQLSRSSLNKAIAYSLKNRLDHLAVLPKIHAEQPIVGTILAAHLFLSAVAVRLRDVSNSESQAFVGSGAFNLVRTAFLETTHGLEWLRLEVIDDGALGQMIKRAGGRCDVLSGSGEVEVAWYPTLRSLLLGGGSRMMCFVGFSYFKMFIQLAALFLMAAMPLLILLSGAQPLYQLAILLGWYTLLLFSAIQVAPKFGDISLRYLVFLPIGFFLLCALMVFSMCATWLRGGLFWRGTVYPLAELKRLRRIS